MVFTSLCWIWWGAVACRGLVMPGAIAWLDAPYPILVLSSGVWWSLLLDTRYLWRHRMMSCSGLQPTFWRSLLTQHAYLATPELGRAGGAVKQFMAMETYKKQKNFSYYACFCSSTMLTSKIITEIIENHSEFSGCSKSCDDCFKSILINYEITQGRP